MRSTILTLLIVASFLTAVGFLPCLGWINWIGIPVSMSSMVLSIVALSESRGTPDAPRPTDFYVGALTGSVLLLAFGSMRWVLGGGCL